MRERERERDEKKGERKVNQSRAMRGAVDPVLTLRSCFMIQDFG